MIVGCLKCKRKFDSKLRSTICPHPTLAVCDDRLRKGSYISPELDKALDEFVADKPKSIIKDV